MKNHPYLAYSKVDTKVDTKESKYKDKDVERIRG